MKTSRKTMHAPDALGMLAKEEVRPLPTPR
jgi:hypothetical protein